MLAWAYPLPHSSSTNTTTLRPAKFTSLYWDIIPSRRLRRNTSLTICRGLVPTSSLPVPSVIVTYRSIHRRPEPHRTWIPTGILKVMPVRYMAAGQATSAPPTQQVKPLAPRPTATLLRTLPGGTATAAAQTINHCSAHLAAPTAPQPTATRLLAAAAAHTPWRAGCTRQLTRSRGTRHTCVRQ